MSVLHLLGYMHMVPVLKLYLPEVSSFLFDFVDKDLIVADSRQPRCLFCPCLWLKDLIQIPLMLPERFPFAS